MDRLTNRLRDGQKTVVFDTLVAICCRVGLVEHLRCLLESGADPRRENNLGRIPLHIACASHDAVQVIAMRINHTCLGQCMSHSDDNDLLCTLHSLLQLLVMWVNVF